jgi:multicomponent Na+:H+ antiporter subunit B
VTARSRQLVLGLGLLGSAALLLLVFLTLPAVGKGASAYGDTINLVAKDERQVTDTVAAVTFDYRGFDTLGEEAMLFAAVLGVVILLREREQTAKSEDERPGATMARHPSEAVRMMTLATMGATVVFGLYIITHGQLTPGGGFQGGVILSTAPLLAYLAAQPSVLGRIAPEWLSRSAEATGLLGYLGLGLYPLLRGGSFLNNFLPLGRLGDVFSSGTIFVLSLATGMAVAAGFIYLLTSFLEEARETRKGD